MKRDIQSICTGTILEDEIQLTLAELSRGCSVQAVHILEMVDEGILEPLGDDPVNWRFPGDSLRRARTALRLQRDLEINLPGAAMVVDLLDEIDRLHARLRQLERG
jgi:chaperone modulatory protein CbpM